MRLLSSASKKRASEQKNNKLLFFRVLFSILNINTQKYSNEGSVRTMTLCDMHTETNRQARKGIDSREKPRSEKQRIYNNNLSRYICTCRLVYFKLDDVREERKKKTIFRYSLMSRWVASQIFLLARLNFSHSLVVDQTHGTKKLICRFIISHVVIAKCSVTTRL